MNRGQVKEFDSPLSLLDNPHSLFSKMVECTGPSASRKLHQMAEEAHLRCKRSLYNGGGVESLTPGVASVQFPHIDQ